MTPFLSGRISNILVQTWTIEEEMLRAFLPFDLQPDRWEGVPVVSLTAAELVDPRALGVPLPGRRRVPQLALEIPVKDGRRRGRRYLKQIVPRPLVANLARFAVNEPFMTATYQLEGDEHIIRQGGREHRIGWTTEGDPRLPAERSFEEFMCNRQWVLGKHWVGVPLALRVDHPRWRVWRDVRPRMDWDPALLFGEPWRYLVENPPMNTFVAEGSAIEVHAMAGLVEGPRAPMPREAAAT